MIAGPHAPGAQPTPSCTLAEPQAVSPVLQALAQHALRGEQDQPPPRCPRHLTRRISWRMCSSMVQTSTRPGCTGVSRRQHALTFDEPASAAGPEVSLGLTITWGMPACHWSQSALCRAGARSWCWGWLSALRLCSLLRGSQAGLGNVLAHM